MRTFNTAVGALIGLAIAAAMYAASKPRSNR